MGISSVGAGSGILTQDVLDKLRKSDEASQIQPIDFNIALEKDRQNELSVIEASMENFIDSINELKSATLFDQRKATIDGDSITMSVDSNSDIQEFSLEVENIATKQIEESGSFSSKTDEIANNSGNVTLSVGTETFTISYDADTTLEEFKNEINRVAGEKVDATIVQVDSSDFRLFISSAETGNNQDISIVDNSSNLKNTKLTSDLTAIQTGEDAKFKFDGLEMTRHSNDVDDLISGYNITLKEAGTSNVSVGRDDDEIMDKIDSFVEKYNAVIQELAEATKSTTEAEERGIFSGDSTIKNMKSAIEDIIGEVGEGVATLYDFGFDVSKDGTMSVDKTVIEEKLEENPDNVEAFFTGGDYTKDDGSTVSLTGVFVEISNEITPFTKTDGTLDQFSDSLDDRLSELQEEREDAVERLDARYEILKKQFIAYDLMITKLTSASNAFTQMINAQYSAKH